MPWKLFSSIINATIFFWHCLLLQKVFHSLVKFYEHGNFDYYEALLSFCKFILPSGPNHIQFQKWQIRVTLDLLVQWKGISEMASWAFYDHFTWATVNPCLFCPKQCSKISNQMLFIHYFLVDPPSPSYCPKQL